RNAKKCRIVALTARRDVLEACFIDRLIFPRQRRLLAQPPWLRRIPWISLPAASPHPLTPPTGVLVLIEGARRAQSRRKNTRQRNRSNRTPKHHRSSSFATGAPPGRRPRGLSGE